MIATAGAPQYEACVRAVAEDPAIDAVVVIFTSLEMIDGPSVATGIVNGAAACQKPVLVCFMGSVRSREAVEIMRQAGLAVYTFPEDAAHALAALVRYHTWRERPAGAYVRFDDIQRETICAIIDAARAGGRRQLTLDEAQRVFEAAGVPYFAWRSARDPEEAAAAATAIGFPVVVKLSSAVVTHKTDIGGVRLGLQTAAQVRLATSEMLDRVRTTDPAATVIVQRMARSGTEVIMGSSCDPKFGPLMMFGLGGIFVEVLKDVAFRMHPLCDVDAHDMIQSIKGYALLAGARGRQPVHLPTLETALLRLSQLLAEFPEIVEFDINPFFAAPSAAESGAADARITLA
jgi:acetyltransferase